MQLTGLPLAQIVLEPESEILGVIDQTPAVTVAVPIVRLAGLVLRTTVAPLIEPVPVITGVGLEVEDPSAGVVNAIVPALGVTVKLEAPSVQNVTSLSLTSKLLCSPQFSLMIESVEYSVSPLCFTPTTTSLSSVVTGTVTLTGFENTRCWLGLPS